MKAFHCSYFVAGENNDLYSRVQVLDFDNQWQYVGEDFGDGAVYNHAEYLRKLGVNSSRDFAHAARSLRFAIWNNEVNHAPKTPFWTDGKWVCIGTDAVLIEVIQDVFYKPRHGVNTFYFSIIFQYLKGRTMVFDQELPLRDQDWICVEFLKLAGWSDQDAKAEAQNILRSVNHHDGGNYLQPGHSYIKVARA